jgi:hypothetical protein
MQRILLEETETDRDYFEKMWKEINDLVQAGSSEPSPQPEYAEPDSEEDNPNSAISP